MTTVDNTKIPEAAKCTDQEDFVLLCTATSYASQLVRLAAVEKGAKWKSYECSYATNT